MKHRTILILLTTLILFGIHGIVGRSSVQAGDTVTLRQAADQIGFLVGTAVQSQPLWGDATYQQMIAQQYNFLTPENALKFRYLSPAEGQYNFKEADQMVTFALSHNMQVRGHTLIWYLGDPTWLSTTNYTRDQMIALLQNHIRTVVGHYRGQIRIWDVVNEAVNPNGTLRNTIWLQKIGPEYIEMAFRAAHEADPDALLFYNDYSNEGSGSKSDAIYNMVKDFVQRGVPINGVGFQLHTSINTPPSVKDITNNMSRLGALGLQVQISEMDVQVKNASGTTDDILKAQAAVYSNILDTCLQTKVCTGFTTWGFTDRYTWIAQPDMPLPFDMNYQAKPAYLAINSTLASRMSAPQLPPQPTEPTTPTIVVETKDGAQVSVTFKLYQVTNVYGLEVSCQSDPNALQGASHVESDSFNGKNSFFIDQGYNAANGNWKIAASRLYPNKPISGNMTAFAVNYTPKTAGNHTVNCTVLAVDQNGRDLPLPVVNGLMPAMDVLQDPTQEPLTMPQQISALSTISGTVSYQNREDNAGISVNLIDSSGTMLDNVMTDASGTYTFVDVPPGNYTIEAAAPQHLKFDEAVQLSDSNNSLQLGTATLRAGDTDNNGVIDISDAGLIGANLNLEVPLAPANADMNQDNEINIADLVLVGANFGMTTSPGS
jgi:endo-1,4-beta-xylanase